MTVQLNPISYKYHFIASQYVRKWGAKTVVDVGGIGGLQQFVDAEVIDANREHGVDGRKLPYADKLFDACVTINTLEHVGGSADQKKFLEECIRVSKSLVAIFPFGPDAVRVEKVKAAIGHSHGCQVPQDVPVEVTERRVLTTCREHLLSLALAPTQLPRNKYLEMLVAHEGNYEMNAQYTVLVSV